MFSVGSSRCTPELPVVFLPEFPTRLTEIDTIDLCVPGREVEGGGGWFSDIVYIMMYYSFPVIYTKQYLVCSQTM